MAIPSFKTIFASVESIIQAKIDASSGALGDVKKIHVGGGYPPLANCPVIVLGADRMRKEHKRASGDVSLEIAYGVQFDWFIAIVSITGDLETSFNQSDDILTELFPTIDENYSWGGLVDDTNYDGDIEFGSNIFGDPSLLNFNIVVPLTSNYRWGRS